MLSQDDRHEECMYALKKLAQEIKDMDEYERLKTLEWVIKLEVEGRGNRFWILVVKCLLGKPELLSSAIKLANQELGGSSNIRYISFGNDVQQAQPNMFGQNVPNFYSFLGGLSEPA